MTQRALKIIELLTASRRALSGADLSDRIGVSARTIRSDIKSFSAQLQAHGARVRSTARSGYRIEIVDEAAFQSFIDGERRDSVRLTTAEARMRALMAKLLQNALQNKPVTQAALSEELFVSLSTLKHMLKEAAGKLEKYRLRIAAYKNRGIRVEGDEAQIRYCIAEYIFDRERQDAPCLDDFYKALFPNIDLDGVADIILQVVAASQIKLADTAVKNLLIHTAIAMQRAAARRPMLYTAGEVKRIEREAEFAVAGDIAERIYRDLGVDVAAGEVYYIARHLIASKKYSENLPDDSKARRGELIGQIIEKVREASGIDFSGDAQLLAGLSVHLDAAIPRMRFQMNMRNEALELIKKEYPAAFSLGLIAGGVIEAKERLRVNENEVGYIAVHFGAALNRRSEGKGADVKRALIVCANGIGMAILLKTKLNKYFAGRIEVVQTIAGYRLTQGKVDSVDLILTAAPIAHIESDKIIHIRRLLNDDEIARIERRVFGKTIKEELLPEFFRADCFYRKMRLRDKWEVIEFLTRRAAEKHLMSASAVKSVREREEASSTEIGNLVAIPHPMISDAEVSSISILILDKPILWDEQQVQVVFLISIAKNQFALWETVFLKLFDYLVKENGVKSMIQEPDFDSFMRCFTQKF